MIQRKQTIFLLIAIAALAMCFMYPVATFTAKGSLGQTVDGALNLIPKDNPNLMAEILSGEPVTMGQKGFVKVWPLTVLTLLSATIALVALFLYKKRVLQMRVVAVAFLLGVIDIFLIFIWAVDRYVENASSSMGCTDVNVHYALGTWLPIAAVVFLFLAQRSIKKDEEKVRAADRLR